MGNTAWDGVISAVENPLAEQTPWEFEYIEKSSFSAMDEPAFREALEAAFTPETQDQEIPVRTPGKKHKNVILCGIESHVCVLLTALDLLAEGYEVFLPADAVSSRKNTDKKFAILRARDAGATITTVESILFELLKDTKSPSFKEISALVK
jgi:nicotinamidase-related amidase